MSDKSRLCPACGTYIPDGKGAKVREPDGSEWFVHNRPGCASAAWVIETEDDEAKALEALQRASAELWEDESD